MSIKAIVILFFCLYLIDISHEFNECSADNAKNTILGTLNGKVEGDCKQVTVSYLVNVTIDVMVWFSIPYAQPPIKENRFKAPVPIGNWTNTKDGMKPPFTCWNTRLAPADEDCLYLNIWVTADTYKNRAKVLKPILVFIHGSEPVDFNNNYPFEVVAIQDIIYVTFNYRLGALGFLYMKDEPNASGNQALLDQNMALKWIYDNAERFGGDKSKITLGGQSIGAWYVGYHLFIPSSWTYFRNGIMQSGGATTISKLKTKFFKIMK